MILGAKKLFQNGAEFHIGPNLTETCPKTAADNYHRELAMKGSCLGRKKGTGRDFPALDLNWPDDPKIGLFPPL